MENKINIDKIYNHWISTSDDDFETMLNLYKSKDYHWALFIGHIVIERLLKASIVNETKDHAPLSHDLRRLAKLSKLKFEEDHLNWLDIITSFNLNTRYDNYKQAFYKKCNTVYTKEWISNIKIIRKWIKKQL